MKGIGLAVCGALAVAGGLPAQEENDRSPLVPEVDVWFEVKTNFRYSEENRFRVPFDFPAMGPAFLETVDAGGNFDISIVTLIIDARWSKAIAGRIKLDLIDLYDCNPTSTDRKYDLDEVWLRFGQEPEPAVVPDRRGGYLKIGKFPKFERQDDRHLESYGLVATAFNRFEDAGVELGGDLGRTFYVKASVTSGNPVFMRDPNALAGDNGTPSTLDPSPDGRPPRIKSGIPILYDAEVEDFGLGEDPELGIALGVRAELGGGTDFDLLVYGYRRKLADTVSLTGTRYGGDLDLLRGPFDDFPFPITSDDKEEAGATLWLYHGGFSLFMQGVTQEIAGLPRQGFEAELAWVFDLPLKWATGGRQLFPWIQPAVRYSRLDNDFSNPPATPSPSFSWDWEKLDVGLRARIYEGVEVTAEYAFNRFETAGGTRSNDELLVTLRWGS